MKRSRQEYDLDDCTQMFVEIFGWEAASMEDVQARALEIAKSEDQDLHDWKDKVKVFLSTSSYRKGPCVPFIAPILQTLKERLLAKTKLTSLSDETLLLIARYLPSRDVIHFSQSNKMIYDLTKPQIPSHRVLHKIFHLKSPRIQHLSQDEINILEYALRPQQIGNIIDEVEPYRETYFGHYINLLSVFRDVSLSLDNSYALQVFMDTEHMEPKLLHLMQKLYLDKAIKLRKPNCVLYLMPFMTLQDRNDIFIKMDIGTQLFLTQLQIPIPPQFVLEDYESD